MDRAYVGRLERGLENPTVMLLEKLAGALDIQSDPLISTVTRLGLETCRAGSARRARLSGLSERWRDGRRKSTD